MSQLENTEYPDWYWLNEHAKTFLSRGYLLDGVSAKDRIIQIANYAENRLGIEGYAEKFLNYMKKGYYSLSSPIWANFGIPHRGLSISCFTGDTKVIVKLEDKEYSTHLEIRDIVDRLTKGEVIYALSYNEEKKETEYKRILKAWKTKESEVVRVTIQDDNEYCKYGENTVGFKCTSDHKFLTENGWKEAKDIAGESLITFNDTYVEVFNVERIDRIYEVYDLTVEDNHNFFVVDSYEYDHPEDYYDDETEEWEYEYYSESNDIGVCVHNCFGSYVGDSISDLKFTDGEIGIMSKFGGGTSAYFGHVRPRGSIITNNGHSNGSYSFLPMFQATVSSVNQGNCYDDKTEVLTHKGWVLFKDVKYGEHKLAQVDEYNNINFTEEYELVQNYYKGDMYKFSGVKREELMDLLVTPNHRMVIEPLKKSKRNPNIPIEKRRPPFWFGRTKIVEAKDFKPNRDNRVFTSGRSVAGDMNKTLTPEECMRIAFQADGRKDGPNRKIRFRFSKQRKIDRMVELCYALGKQITYKESYEKGSRVVDITFDYDENLKYEDFSWIDLTKVSHRWANDFLREVSLWDGSHSDNIITYSSTNKFNVDMVQSVAVLSGRRTTYTCKDRSESGRQTLHGLIVTNIPYTIGESIKSEVVQYDGKIYCAIVPTGRLMVRRNNRTLICGNTRRGAMAAYIDIDHADIEEWLNIREDGEEIQHLHWGVCVGNDWLEEMKAGDSRKRDLWAKVLRSRIRTGEPYIFFKDNVNNGTVDIYKDKNMVIHASNLCSEILLPSSIDESFVCCLSSMNLLHYDEWKDTDAVETMVYFLDVVMTDFIEQTKVIDEVNGFPWFAKARRFAERHRALGLGVLGWHSYLQRNMIPFGSFRAMQKNNEIFKTLKEKAYKASEDLAKHLGEPELLKGYGRRHTTLLAIAPTKSSSFILGAVSPSIEPFKSNCYVKDLAKIKVVFKNPFLEKIIKERGMDNDEVWQSIITREGSVQHLDFLTEEEKNVFKTFDEISQVDVIQQAAQRQQYIDQGQSLNITVHKDMPFKEVNRLHLLAAELGVKGLYYQLSTSAAQAFNRDLITCSSCEA